MESGTSYGKPFGSSMVGVGLGVGLNVAVGLGVSLGASFVTPDVASAVRDFSPSFPHADSASIKTDASTVNNNPLVFISLFPHIFRY